MSGLNRYFGATGGLASLPGTGITKPISGSRPIIGAPPSSRLHTTAKHRLLQAYVAAKLAQNKMMSIHGSR